MDEKEYLAAVARSIYWGYLKDTTGTPGKWSDLQEEDRKVWLNIARRAYRKIRELDGQSVKK